MDFVAVDVETANSNLSSVCQLGAVVFRQGKVVDKWTSFVDPEDEFSPINVWIHGIDEEKVRNSPKWDIVYETLRHWLEGNIVVSHTSFDRVSFTLACQKYKLALYESRWLDSAKVVRRTWPEFSKSGYGLGNIAARLGIVYKAHDALEDAYCAGEILIRAITETGLSMEDWLNRVALPVHSATHSVEREGNPDGALHGEVVVFTGAISMTRFEAADAAAVAGCKVDAGVTKRTTLLVVGDQDVRRLAGKMKSSKQCKAEVLIGRGQKLRILSENDFIAMIQHP